MPLSATLRCDDTRSPARWRELLLDTRVAGVPLLKRHLLTLAHADVRDTTIVVPSEIIEEVRHAADGYLHDTPTMDLNVEPVRPTQPAWRAEGPSESPWGRADVVVEQRADTLVDPRLVSQLVRLVQTQSASLECVDRAGSERDLKSPYKVGVAAADEAKPLTQDFRLQGPGFGNEPAGIGEYVTVQASGFDAIGTSRGFERARATETGSQQPAGETAFIPIGFRVRAPGEDTVFLDIGRYYWHHFDGPADAAIATRKVLLATMKETDGIYARTNRRVSLPISRMLLDTPVTPNMVTLATLGCSVFAGWLLSVGHYPAVVAGSVAAWLASMLDGVDGELARARFQVSAFGHWLEMTCDYAFYIFLALGLGMGVRHVTGRDIWLLIGIGAALGVVASFSVVAHLKRSYARQGSMGDFYLAYQRTVSGQPSLFLRFTPHLTALMTRAGFPYFLVAFCVLGLGKLLLVLFLVSTQSFWLVALYTSRLRVSLD